MGSTSSDSVHDNTLWINLFLVPGSFIVAINKRSVQNMSYLENELRDQELAKSRMPGRPSYGWERDAEERLKKAAKKDAERELRERGIYYGDL